MFALYLKAKQGKQSLNEEKLTAADLPSFLSAFSDRLKGSILHINSIITYKGDLANLQTFRVLIMYIN